MASPPICTGSRARARAHIAVFASCQSSMPFAAHGVSGPRHAPPLAHACSLLLFMPHGFKEHVWCTILTLALYASEHKLQSKGRALYTLLMKCDTPGVHSRDEPVRPPRSRSWQVGRFCMERQVQS